MQHSSAKLALTGTLAALLWAIPVSIDLAMPHAATANQAAAVGIAFKVDSAEARIGYPATPGSVAGVARRTTRRTVRRTTYGAAVVAAPVAGAAVAPAGVAARCTTVLVNGVAVRRCGRVVY
jgi:hypothetical protein